MTRKTGTASPTVAESRGGVVLLVVIALLALFAAVGVSFVYYAEAEGAAARYFVEAQNQRVPDVEPELLLAYFLNQLIFDVKDDVCGVSSALRGHGLLRSMWGTDYEINANGNVDLGNNTAAYNGTGRLHQVHPPAAPTPLASQDDYQLINYTYFPADGFLRDPERQGFRASPAAARGPFQAGLNAAYTYPDLNSLFLAAGRADGTMLMPSFHRPWLFGPLDASNPNWTNQVGKYLVMRPRPKEHPPLNGKPGFPFPEDATGDVKNRMGPGGNDSIWLDLGFPVLTHSDGRKYKPLFAPLIIDLDGKVNLNAHGNVRGVAGSHVSNQGWGPWEVNLASVLAADADEWKNLFLGGSGPLRGLGRYGPDQQPTPNSPLPVAVFGPTPSRYAQVDFDSCQINSTPTPPLALPGGTSCFPTFPPGYDNAAFAECLNHPSLFNVLGPPGGNAAGFDRRFTPFNLEWLLRYGDTGSPSLTSNLAYLCPKNFQNDRIRRLVTTDSYDSRRPGLAPWVWGSAPYAMTARPQSYPSVPESIAGGGVKPYPEVLSSSSIYDDFSRQGRAGDAPLTRVDLNRFLPAYPPPDALTRQITDMVAFTVAQQARQMLARDIFLRLVKACGAYDPTRYMASSPPVTTTPPTLQELQTLRWLAQYAVNIVDFIDKDDYQTPFPWGSVGGSAAFAAVCGNQWVCGTELPRALINEVYAEYVNQPGETGPADKATRFYVNLWVELYNPLPSDPTLRDQGDAWLDGAYQLVVSRSNTNLLSAGDQDNVLGDPDNTSATQVYSNNQVRGTLTTFNPPQVPTCDKAGQGFYVLGPPDPVPGANCWDPGAAFGTMRTPALSYQVRVKRGNVLTPSRPTLMLRRLACPNLPYQPNAALDSLLTPYNPYVTVDYSENVPLNRGISNTGAGPSFKPTPLAKRTSYGRTQPFDGNPLMDLAQAPTPALANQPQNTFFQHNQDSVFNPRASFDWLVHLDRPLISPMEVLHASSCRPHQLTHMFKDTTNNPYQSFNQAPYWLLQNAASPLYRAFELFETASRAGGAAQSDRIPGKININTIWDPEIFLALCDPQAANYFTSADVQQIYQWMTASRTANANGVPGPNDRPFKCLANAEFLQAGSLYAEGNGIRDTLLRDNPNHPLYDAALRPIRLFEIVKQDLAGQVIQDHPYQRLELLTKIFNQTTTRSNVFAVWLTVGFFEVNDDTSLPVSLGAEMGRAEGRHIRHRMFAIVDRSQLLAIFPDAGQPPITSSTPAPGPGQATVFPTLMSGTSSNSATSNYNWTIQPGMILRVTGKGTDGLMASEDVVVSDVTGSSFTATFSRTYPNGFVSIVAYGNPGPRPVFNPRDYPALIPYFNVIN